jgi:ribosome-associated toxin RatA of RatAB toxin-antitoxin module
MTVRIYLSKEVRSSVQHILDYFMNIEELPRFHPEYVKNVRIIHRQGSNNDMNIEFEQEASFHGKKIKSMNRLIRHENSIRIETIDGNGKGSRTNIRCQELSPENAIISLEGELHYGLLEKLLSGSIHAITERMLKEDIRNIERGLIKS